MFRHNDDNSSRRLNVSTKKKAILLKRIMKSKVRYCACDFICMCLSYCSIQFVCLHRKLNSNIKSATKKLRAAS